MVVHLLSLAGLFLFVLFCIEVVDSSLAVNNANTTVEFGVPATLRTVPASLLSLQGANVASPSIQHQTVEKDTYGDGWATPLKKIGVDTSYDVSGVYVDSVSGRTLYQLSSISDDTDKEIYAKLTYGNGDIDTFWGLVLNYSEGVTQRDVKRFSCTFRANTPVVRSFIFDNPPVFNTTTSEALRASPSEWHLPKVQVVREANAA